MQAYNAYRLQTELNKAPKVATLERPWEISVPNTTTSATVSPKTNDKPVKMETDAKVVKTKSKEKKDNGNHLSSEVLFTDHIITMLITFL